MCKLPSGLQSACVACCRLLQQAPPVCSTGVWTPSSSPACFVFSLQLEAKVKAQRGDSGLSLGLGQLNAIIRV